jgi:trehalose-6-phosphatase
LQITTILSDYDGTLCSTASLRRTKDNGRIPKELEEILLRLSGKVPICIISSKDFAFLHERTRFANILVCVLGMETVVHNSHYGDNKINNFDCIRMKHLIVNIQSLLDSSKLLYNVLKILQNNKDITIEEKYTSNREILIGLTIDYRAFRELAIV